MLKLVPVTDMLLIHSDLGSRIYS